MMELYLERLHRGKNPLETGFTKSKDSQSTAELNSILLEGTAVITALGVGIPGVFKEQM